MTFQLSANYFLFATLEQARPIAQGRVPQDSSRATVLTGTPVAGMVYLDRPEPAGYFIFPDLSVRHEGKYRLGFSLYEELKDMKDADRIDENGSQAQGLGEACVTHRLEVKSQPFTVYSAKKFPGLASSTSLSRTVAEQGCRVRIRRDVRMRRRDNKPGKDGYDGYSDGGYDRSRQSATPDMYQQQHMSQTGRGRSASIASPISLLGGPQSRRTSLQDMSHGYPQQQPGYGSTSPLQQNLGSAPLSQSQYGAPLQPPQYQPQFSYPQSQMPPPQMSYQGYQFGQGPPPVAQQSYQYAQPTQVAPPPPYEADSHARNHSGEYVASAGADSRRGSTMVHPPVYQYGAQSHNGQSQYAGAQGTYGVQVAPRETGYAPSTTLHHQIASTGPQVLPPINTTLQSRDKLESLTPTTAAPVSHTYYGAGVNQAVPDMNSHAGAKRGYDRVFPTEHMNAPLRQGARPSLPYVHTADQDHDDGVAKMSYRRADGREFARPFPPSI